MKTIYVNNSSSRVSDDDARRMCSAITTQLARDVCAPWGREAPALIFTDNPPPGAFLISLVDTLPDAPDALGYHTEGSGVISGLIGVGPTLDAGEAVSGVLSHEALELLMDPHIDYWADAPDGFSYPLEVCDAVQGDTYTIDGVVVSNFLLPAWFSPSLPGPFDFMKKLTAPFTLASGGYSVRRPTGGGETQIFGTRPAWKKSLRGVQRQR